MAYGYSWDAKRGTRRVGEPYPYRIHRGIEIPHDPNDRCPCGPERANHLPREGGARWLAYRNADPRDPIPEIVDCILPFDTPAGPTP